MNSAQMEELLRQILESEETLLDFGSFMAWQYKHSLNHILQLYSQGARGMAYATIKQWARTDRSIREGAQEYSLTGPDGKETIVFGYEDTNGAPLHLWQLPADLVSEAIQLTASTNLEPEEQSYIHEENPLTWSLYFATGRIVNRGDRPADEKSCTMTLASFLCVLRIGMEDPTNNLQPFGIRNVSTSPLLVFESALQISRTLLAPIEKLSNNYWREKDMELYTTCQGVLYGYEAEPEEPLVNAVHTHSNGPVTVIEVDPGEYPQACVYKDAAMDIPNRLVDHDIRAIPIEDDIVVLYSDADVMDGNDPTLILNRFNQQVNGVCVTERIILAHMDESHLVTSLTDEEVFRYIAHFSRNDDNGEPAPALPQGEPLPITSREWNQYIESYRYTSPDGKQYINPDNIIRHVVVDDVNGLERKSFYYDTDYGFENSVFTFTEQEARTEADIWDRPMYTVPRSQRIPTQPEPIPEPQKAGQKREERLYRRFREMFSTVFDGTHRIIELSAGESFMPLIVEHMGEDKYRVSHIMTVQHDVKLPDPSIVYHLDHEAGTLEPLSYADTTGHQEVYQDGKPLSFLRNDFLSFSVTWFKNIREQGYTLVYSQGFDPPDPPGGGQPDEDTGEDDIQEPPDRPAIGDDQWQILVIEPGKEPYARIIPATLDAMQGVVDGRITSYEYDKGVDIISLDEYPGEPVLNRRVGGMYYGETIFLIGNRRGKYISLTDEQVDKYGKLFSGVDVPASPWSREQSDEFLQSFGEAISVFSFEEDDFITPLEAEAKRRQQEEFVEDPLPGNDHPDNDIAGASKDVPDTAIPLDVDDDQTEETISVLLVEPGKAPTVRSVPAGSDQAETLLNPDYDKTYLSLAPGFDLIADVIPDVRPVRMIHGQEITGPFVIQRLRNAEAVSLTPLDIVKYGTMFGLPSLMDAETVFYHSLLKYSLCESVTASASADIYRFFRENEHKRKRGTFLKSQRDAFQRSLPLPGDGIYSVITDASQLHITYRDTDYEIMETLSWSDIASLIDGYILDGDYPIPEDWEEPASPFDLERGEQISFFPGPATPPPSATKPRQAEPVPPRIPHEEASPVQKPPVDRAKRIPTIAPPLQLEGTNYHLPADYIASSNLKTKYERNVEAITLLKELEADKRPASSSEQEVLSRFTGWGGIPKAFDPQAEDWKTEYDQLRALLDKSEYRAARASTLNAHYTSVPVIDAMYKAVRRFGFTPGNILEPAVGTGHFFGRLPSELTGSKLYATELDSITGRIAQQLYPQANVQVCGFQETGFPNDFFDLCISNVPFGDYTISDDTMRKGYRIHDYFFLRSINLTRPGGLLAYVTSTGTLDKKGDEIRREIAQKTDFLGAVRLPRGTFRNIANTEVSTDIIFLQKRETPNLSSEDTFLSLGETPEGFPINRYYAEHPEMLCGVMEVVHGQFGQVPDLVDRDHNAMERLSRAMELLPRDIYTAPDRDLNTEDADDIDLSQTLPALPHVKNFGYTVIDGQIYRRQGSIMALYHKQKGMVPQRIKGQVEIRDITRELIQAQLNDLPEEEIAGLRERLNDTYDRFVKRYGVLNNIGNTRAFRMDADFALVCSLEKYNKQDDTWEKADMFSKRTIRPRISVDHVETANEALLVSLSQRGRIDFDYMSALSGLDRASLISDLKTVIYQNPEALENSIGGWEIAGEYLSGNVREKLVAARKAEEAQPGRFAGNIEALEQVQPKWIESKDIFVKLGTTWIPEEDVKDFVCDLLQLSNANREYLHVNYIKASSSWIVDFTNRRSIKEDSLNINRYGTRRAAAIDLIECQLNQRLITITDKGEGNTRVYNNKETLAAREKQGLINAEFCKWIFADPERTARLEGINNNLFNANRLREYDGSHLTFEGMNPNEELEPHQKNAVARILYGGNTLLAHCVGAGKTFEMVALVMEMKRLSLVAKPIIIVPNHLCEQFSAEFMRLYPNANILCATKEDFEGPKRKKLMSRIATGEWDSVIVGHSSFGRIPVSQELQTEFLQKEADAIEAALSAMDSDDGASRRTVKQMESALKKAEERIKRLATQRHKDNVVTFEELGIDFLCVDEAHEFKNLYLFSSMANISGINSSRSQKASDLYMKSKYLERMNGDGNGLVFATGTPISNSLCEMYTMMRYLMYHELEKMGLENFDAWASVFGKVVAALELSPDGSGYRISRFAKFKNLPELMTAFRLVADIQTKRMLNLPTPPLLNGKFDVVVAPSNDTLQMVIEDLMVRAEHIRQDRVKPDEDNMLKVTTDGRKAALDVRLLRERYGSKVNVDYADSKINKVVDNVHAIWEETLAEGYAQVVFMDQSTPKGDRWSLYQEVKAKLAMRGIPEAEIAFIHDAKTDEQKQNLFDRINDGDIRVILGSTAKLGAGTNMQKRLYALHHVDCPWRPADMEQREGRIDRQGNECPYIRIFRYVTERSFDAYNYQTLETKAKFIAQIMDYSDIGIREAEDIDTPALTYEQMKIISSGNPLIKEKFEIDTEVTRLRTLKSQYMDTKRQQEYDCSRWRKEVMELENRISRSECDLEKVKDTSGDKFHMTLGGVTYKSR